MLNLSVMWIAFALLVITMLALDLGLNRKCHEISFKEAIVWSVIWITLSMIFNIGIYFLLGKVKALEFFTGYVIEKSLSVDNLFVFVMIFGYFNIRKEHQARILKWGILSALVLRGIFIFTGIGLLKHFDWLFYVFGVLLVVTAIRMAFGGDEKIEPEKSWVIKTARKFFPFTKKVHGDWFFKRQNGILVASPLFLVLMMVESSDVVFAVDSIPAVFAVTLDPFIVFTSNIFAILGLRALYFLLANVVGMFVYLKIGISFILAFVGCKMLASAMGFHIPIQVSLLIIFASLFLSVLASVTIGRRREHKVARVRESI